MARTKHPSPCCNVKSEVRLLSLQEGQIILRCSACARLRIEKLAGTPTDPPPRHLKLIVSK